MASQWRVSMSGLVGLDYPAVFQVAEALAVEMTPGMIKKIQALERKVMQRGEA